VLIIITIIPTLWLPRRKTAGPAASPPGEPASVPVAMH
jgi:hypothetical protein